MNKVFLIGRLTKEPELKQTGSGIAVCTFSLAVDRRVKSKDGEKKTDFFNVVAWRRLGELCGQYLAKGRKIAVLGELQTRSYEANDGSKRHITEINAEEVEFLSPKKSEECLKNEDDQDYMEGFSDIQDEDLPF